MNLCSKAHFSIRTEDHLTMVKIKIYLTRQRPFMIFVILDRLRYWQEMSGFESVKFWADSIGYHKFCHFMHTQYI